MSTESRNESLIAFETSAYKIQAALTGAKKLLEDVVPVDDRGGEFWSARELVDLALAEVSDLYAHAENLKISIKG